MCPILVLDSTLFERVPFRHMVAIGIIVAAIAALVLSSIYYSVAPKLTASGEARPSRPRPWKVILELVRSALVSGLVAGILIVAGWGGPAAGVLLGLALTVIPIVLLSGSVTWEGVPWRVALLHTGDWVIKLAAIGLIVGFFV